METCDNHENPKHDNNQARELEGNIKNLANYSHG